MTETAISSKSAWSNGVTIEQALERYTDDKAWTEFEELQARLFPLIPEDLLEGPINWEPQPPMAVSPQQLFGRYLELQGQLRVETINYLKNGTLLSIGYARPRHRNDDAAWIPANIWANCKISWDESELWGVDKQYFEVRIVQPVVPITITAESAVIAIHLAPIKGERRPGRPTLAPVIKSAYEAAKAANEIDYEKSLSENIQIIQKFVHNLQGTDSSSNNNLKYEAIRRAIGTQFAHDKPQTDLAKSTL